MPRTLATEHPGALLARQLAPLLYLQRDEWFPLIRTLAVTHPSRPVIAYHLLWRDDAHAAWLPFTIPTDQEVVWVGYDASGAPTDIWTYWHGSILHANWRGKGQVIVDVQWGKHGSMPRSTRERDLPPFKRLGDFYEIAWLGIPDLLLGRLVRAGPLCFCHSYNRYREFNRPLLVAPLLDAIVQTEQPQEALRLLFGASYAEKPNWPW
ncbi:MAG: hypothetical protein H7Z74_03715 [Anaerolineae bacterium]|nr:hypothetical protein [Gemmatimonadaceae bacterium]